MKLESDEWYCQGCHTIYKRGWSEEEALKERHERYPAWDEKDLIAVCDECDKLITEGLRREGYEYGKKLETH